MKNRRRNYYIKPRFQANFFIKFVLLLIIEAVIIASLFMAIAKGTLVTTYKKQGLVVERTDKYFLKEFLLITVIAGAGVACASIAVFIYLTHRIGGALYKFEITLNKVRSGDLSSRVVLRSTDELLEMRDKLNLFLSAIDQKMTSIKAQVDKLHKISSGDGKENDLRKVLDGLRADLDNFNTSK